MFIRTSGRSYGLSLLPDILVPLPLPSLTAANEFVDE
ncbi:MAG: hypothetical protein A4E57_04646 [Syntrophorhabdaceae bacterium PtaU1.Bin034]|nr:MAG: hypothetical protein A4E57_04646 [Syntrophorhabdaceae bacterium PtaU1.Bin034]